MNLDDSTIWLPGFQTGPLWWIGGGIESLLVSGRGILPRALASYQHLTHSLGNFLCVAIKWALSGLLKVPLGSSVPSAGCKRHFFPLLWEPSYLLRWWIIRIQLYIDVWAITLGVCIHHHTNRSGLFSSYESMIPFPLWSITWRLAKSCFLYAEEITITPSYSRPSTRRKPFGLKQYAVYFMQIIR